MTLRNEQLYGIEDYHDLYEKPQRGKVYLIGAGPGDPELMTVKGLRCLRDADVVLYDRLISPLLLEEVRPGAALMYVGKGPRNHSLPQEDINTLLITYARQGCTVARLKGGDPYVFGRGGEEAEALAAASVPFEVIPGVSSAIAVPADTPAAVIQEGTTERQLIVTGTVENIAQLAKEAGLTSPALTVIGTVVNLGEILRKASTLCQQEASH